MELPAKQYSREKLKNVLCSKETRKEIVLIFTYFKLKLVVVEFSTISVKFLSGGSLDGLGVGFQVLMPEDSGSNPEASSIY